jgi:GNAT superfamily N-acetyltransferase
VACGGWRATGDGAEIKRMYVTGAARRAGAARAMLAELERTAQAAGHRRAILETGGRLPEAVALYRSAGYTPVAPFGYYAASPNSIHLGKLLDPEPGP